MTQEELKDLPRIIERGAMADGFLKSDFWLKHVRPHWNQRPLEFDRVWFDPAKRNKEEATENSIFNSGRHAELNEQIMTFKRWVNEGIEAQRKLSAWEQRQKEFSRPKA